MSEIEDIQGKKYPSFGRGIYCGSDGGADGLRDEHIIPKSLGSNPAYPTEMPCVPHIMKQDMEWTKTSDGSIVDQDSKVIFFSTRRFIDDICIGNCCFICGAKPENKPFNDEHVLASRRSKAPCCL